MFLLILSAAPSPPASTIDLLIEACIAVLVSLAFDILIRRSQNTQTLNLILLSFFLFFVSLSYTAIYHFWLKKPEQEYSIIFIIIVCSNFLTQFLSSTWLRDTDIRINIWKKLVMSYVSFCFFVSLGFIGYNLLFSSNLFYLFIGLMSFLLSAFCLVKFFRDFIPL